MTYSANLSFFATKTSDTGAINSGIDGVPIGANTASTGKFTSVTNTGLTSGRIPYVSTGGLLVDSANLTFNGTNLGVQISRTSSTNGIALTLSDDVTGAQTSGVYKSIRSTSNGGVSVSEMRFLEVDGTNNNTGLAFATAPTAGGLTERMRIDNNGNVGIGTASPTEKLMVVGPIVVSGQLQGLRAASSTLDFGPAENYTRIIATGPDSSTYASIIFATTTTTTYAERMRIASGGNVGIGNSNPTAKLDISTSDTADTIGIRRSTNATNGMLKFTTAGTDDWILGQRNTSDSDFHLYNYGTSSDVLKVLRSNGYVGIGTSSPINTLQVAGAVAATGGAGGYAANMALLDVSGGNAQITAIGTNTSTVGTLVFQAFSSNASLGGERMRISSAGYVGIGVTNPTQPLQIGHAVSVEIDSLIAGTRTSTFYTDNVQFVIEAATNIHMAFNTNATERMRITGGGNVGIGTSSPTNKLDVIGGVKAGSSTVYAEWFADALGTYFENTGTSSATRCIRLQSSNGSGSYAQLFVQGGSNYISFATSTTERMRIDSSGNVGIGTSIPGTYGKVAISVTGTATPTTGANVGPASINLFNGGGGGTTNSTMGIFGWHAGEPGLGSGIGFSRDSSGDWAASIRFYTHPSETSNIGVITERMRITGDGNVGIGTTDPGSLFTVSASSATAYLSNNTLTSGQWARISNPSATADAAVTLLFQASGTPGGNGLATISGVATAVGSMAITFGTRDSGSAVVERVRITSGGVLKSGINSSQATSENGVATWNTMGTCANSDTFTFDVTVPDDSGSSTGHHIEANMTHYSFSGYGCLLDTWVSTRGSSLIEQSDIKNITSANGGSWSVSKTGLYTLRITKNAGTYPGGGYYWIKVTTVSTV